MSNPSFDAEKFVKWGVEKALSHVGTRTGLPLGDIVSPIANGLITSLGIQAVEIDPVIFMMGRLVMAGMDRQKKVNQAREEALNVDPEQRGDWGG